MQAGEATRDTAYRTLGYEAPSEQGYESRAYDASSDAYETGKNKLGDIIEVLGWRKATEHDYSNGKHSPYDVLVGNNRYVWHQRHDSDDSYYQKAKDTLGGATDTTSEKASQATNTAYDTAGRAKDTTVDAASRATENVKDVTGRATETAKDLTGRAKDTVVDTASRAKDSLKDITGQSEKTAADYSQRGKEALGAGAAALGADKLG